MPDPAFLMLMQHLQYTPAITRSAPVERGGASAVAFGDYAVDQERKFLEWIEHGRALKAEIWSQVESGRLELTATMIDEMIELHDERLENEAKALGRLEKKVRRDESDLAGRQKVEIVGARQRLVDVARKFYDDKRDFGIFLRAIRAEVERGKGSASDGVASFTDATDLRRFLMS